MVQTCRFLGSKKQPTQLKTHQPIRFFGTHEPTTWHCSRGLYRAKNLRTRYGRKFSSNPPTLRPKRPRIWSKICGILIKLAILTTELNTASCGVFLIKLAFWGNGYYIVHGKATWQTPFWLNPSPVETEPFPEGFQESGDVTISPHRKPRFFAVNWLKRTWSWLTKRAWCWFLSHMHHQTSM